MSFSKVLHTALVIASAVYWILCGVPAGAEEMQGDEADRKPDISLTGEGERVTLRAADAGLVDLVRMLAEEAGINVVLDPDVTGKVTASLTDVTLEQALDMILEANGYAMQRKGKLVRVLKAELLAQSLQSKQLQLRAVPVAEVEEQLKQFLSPQGKVIAHPQKNTLVVVDRPEVIANIEDFLASVDSRERQVTIKAELMEVSFDKRDQFGFEWDWLDTSLLSIDKIRGTVTQKLLPPEADSFHVALGNEHFNTVFEALITDERVNLLSAPKITTVNNQEAKVEITQDIPYIEATTSIEAAAAGGSTTTTESVEFVTVGVKLTVLPQIGEDNLVRMKITPEVSEAPTRFEGIPVVNKRRAETTLIVEDGQTIVLGGLIRENVTDEEKRVPILGSIPLLGNLFKSKDKRVTKVELYIFITPHITDAAFAALDLRESRDSLLEKQEQFE